MWKLLSFLSLFLFTACGSNDSEFKWDQSADSYLYEGSTGKVSVSFGKKSSNKFSLVADPKNNRDGIDMIQVVFSNSFSKNLPHVTVEGLSCCGKKTAKVISLQKEPSTTTESTYRGDLPTPLDKSKPPYTFLFKFKTRTLSIEL